MPLLEVITDTIVEPGEVMLCGADGKPLDKGADVNLVKVLRMHPRTARALEASGKVRVVGQGEPDDG